MSNWKYEEETQRPRTRRIFWLSKEMAKKLGNEVVYLEHVLLSMTQDGEGVGPRVLTNLGVDLDLMKVALLCKYENEP
jgi:ATP-dependent Clp protease ATP-binding subunit ClpC